MSEIPTLRAKEVISILEKLGFEEARQKGSHKIFKHKDSRTTIVPVHGSRDISPRLLRDISKQINMNIRDFVALR
ncbi:MAG: type II toxin-antitoxin system HicA family toxin [Cyanobacteria bacterium MAG CAR2_bin_4]|nr:type II toxin-antitoxin system HicA family toxin [Cyanobacteria bacterium MAG CAR2_bin_4]